MAETLLDAKSLVVGYGGGRTAWGGRQPATPVLNGVSLSIGRGEMVGIVGESGSGKTTLGRALLRLVRPTSGVLMFDKVELTRLDERAMRPMRRRMQLIFQDPGASLNPRHTIRHILTAPLLLHGVAATTRDADKLAGASLERVGLPLGALRRYSHELSGGQRQRVGIARAIMLEPDFIVADEIVSGLDVSTQAQVLRLITDLSREIGLAMAFISHDLSVIRAVCDRVMVMRRGVFVEEGPCATVFAAPRSPYTRRLIDAIPLPAPDPSWLGRDTGPSRP